MSPPASDPDGFPSIPGYRIEGILGRGSMATVYRATQLGMDRTVALKVLRKDVVQNEKVTNRLMREARVAARLNHPHIVRAHDAGIHDGECYFVMDHVAGASLRDILERRGEPLDESTVVRIGIEIGEALNHMHHEHVIHRDIKPANVLLNDNGQAMLADLGLAKLEADSTMTSKNRTVGTPQYMSTEQAKDPDSVDIRSDIFSLGATLYHVATGQSPFEAPSVGAVLTRLLYEQPPTIIELRPELSPEFSAVIERMMTKDRDERYQTPGQLLRDLRALERGAVAPGQRTERRRGPWIAAGSLAFMAVLVLFIWRPWSSNDEGRRTPPVDHKPSVKAGPDPATLSESRLLAAVESTEVPAPAGYRSELEKRVDELLDRHFARSYEDARRNRVDVARRWNEGALDDLIRDRLKRSIDRLPPWLRDRIEAERRLAREKVDEIVRAASRSVLDGARRAYARAVEDIFTSDAYLAPADVAARFARVDIAGSERLDSRGRKQLTEEISIATTTLERRWKARFLARVDEIDGLRVERRFKTARTRVDAERGRGPGVVDVAWSLELDQTEKRLDRAESDLERELATFTATIDRVADRGYPELGRRDFRGVLADIRARLDGLDETEVGAALDELKLLRGIDETLRLARRWIESCGDVFGRLASGATTDLVLRTGQRHPGANVMDIGTETVRIKPRNRPEPIDVAFVDLSVETLLRLHAVDTAEPAAVRAVALLRYCDGEFVALEGLASDHPRDDVVQFFARRGALAHARLNKVETAEGRAAYAHWQKVAALARDGDWRGVLRGIKTLLRERKWVRTAWYRAHETEIDKVRREATARVGILDAVGARAGKVRLIDWSSRTVSLDWRFDAASELEDFHRRPEGAAIDDGRLSKVIASPSVAPADVVPLSTRFPADLETTPFALRMTYRPEPGKTDTPRWLSVSAFGHHFLLLSRLRQNGPFRSLPLHGFEKHVEEVLDIGQVGFWAGDFARYGRVLAKKLGAEPVVLLEGGRTYRIRVVLDPASRTATLWVDDKIVHRATEIDLAPVDDTIAIRAPGAYDILDLSLQGAVRAAR